MTFEDGKLFVQPAGGAKAEIKPRSTTEFFVENRLPVFRFEPDAAGKASALVVFQEEGGTPERAPRVADAPPPRKEFKEIKVNPAIYDAYVGEYELAPGFILTVTREGDRLMTQATGQGKVEVFPSLGDRVLPEGDRRADHVREGTVRLGRFDRAAPGRPRPAGEAEEVARRRRADRPPGSEPVPP